MQQEDRKILLKNLGANALGSAAIVLLAALTGWALWRAALDAEFLNKGQLYVLLPLAAWWVWLLRNCPVQSLKTIDDLRTGKSGTVKGVSVFDSRRGFGLYAPVRQWLVVDGQRFNADGFDLENLKVGRNVRVRYGLASRTLLSVEDLRGVRNPTAASSSVDLSERDAELLKLLAQGHSDKLIARTLGLSPATVRTYNSRLFRKLGVVRRTDAVRLARSRGFLDVDQHPSTKKTMQDKEDCA